MKDNEISPLQGRRKFYLSPTIHVKIIKLEEGLAVMSTQLHPTNSSGEILVEDWSPGSDITEDLDW